MGTWGPGICQNDTTADIWVEFKELYNKGLSLKEIRYKLEKEYKPQSDTEYFGEIWTGVLVEVDGKERLYFVVETKGSLFDED